MLDKLVIGTANFGKKYNGYKVPDDEVEKIWDYCREIGITMADTANAYEYEPPEDFEIITKVTIKQPTLKRHCYAVLAHDIGDLCNPKWIKYLQGLKEKGFAKKIGVSLYPDVVLNNICVLYPEIDILQVPYKPFKSQLDVDAEIHVRKVFADDCYVKALKDKNVDKVVIGIDNLEQLKENVEILRRSHELEQNAESNT
jgi:aryl-alcohol dehydrogenase-like predicted oxidoreductase